MSNSNREIRNSRERSGGGLSPDALRAVLLSGDKMLHDLYAQVVRTPLAAVQVAHVAVAGETTEQAQPQQFVRPATGETFTFGNPSLGQLETAAAQAPKVEAVLPANDPRNDSDLVAAARRQVDASYKSRGATNAS